VPGAGLGPWAEPRADIVVVAPSSDPVTAQGRPRVRTTERSVDELRLEEM
jgi:hypothetical protein